MLCVSSCDSSRTVTITLPAFRDPVPSPFIPSPMRTCSPPVAQTSLLPPAAPLSSPSPPHLLLPSLSFNTQPHPASDTLLPPAHPCPSPCSSSPPHTQPHPCLRPLLCTAAPLSQSLSFPPSNPTRGSGCPNPSLPHPLPYLRPLPARCSVLSVSLSVTGVTGLKVWIQSCDNSTHSTLQLWGRAPMNFPALHVLCSCLQTTESNWTLWLSKT